MTISHSEFLRSLQPLKRYYPISKKTYKNKLLIQSRRLTMEIRLGREEVVKLGALSMPRTKIDLIFHVATAEEKTRFLSRFELCFRRGGG
jgi:hypothetical protein